jgi:hypothetical protein
MPLENIHVFNFTTRMDVQVADAQLIFSTIRVYRLSGRRDTEFAFIMPGGNFHIAACENIRAQANTYRVPLTEYRTEFFELINCRY